MAKYRSERAKKSKYHAKKTVVDGITFASAHEAARYRFLKAQEEAGAIFDLQLQKKYVLIPAQREPDIIGPRGGVRPGKLLERQCFYKADFVYSLDETGRSQVVEDAKGKRTKDYIIKRKLMLWVHGIRVVEV